MLICWFFAGSLLLVSEFGSTKAHLDLSPEEPSFSYCIGPGCTSENPNGQAVNDEGLSESETPGFTCPSNETSIHADPTDCHRYYICFEGNSSLQVCRPEMGYLPESELCVSERFVRSCRVVRCHPHRNGIMYDPADCTRYYNCFYGHPYHLRCAAGTKFDPVSRQCSSTVPCLTGNPHNHNRTFEVDFLSVA